MEAQQMLPDSSADNNHLEVVVRNTQDVSITTDAPPFSNAKPFLEGGTVEATLEEIQKRHIIPVFHRDNETVISQVDFIQTTMEVVHDAFPSERILSPAIRLSHPVKGRVPKLKIHIYLGN